MAPETINGNARQRALPYKGVSRIYHKYTNSKEAEVDKNRMYKRWHASVPEDGILGQKKQHARVATAVVTVRPLDLPRSQSKQILRA